MTWNYRVLRRADKHGNTYLTIGEVYYKPNGDIDGWSSENCIVSEESEGVASIKEQLRRMLSSLRLHPDVIDVVESETEELSEFDFPRLNFPEVDVPDDAPEYREVEMKLGDGIRYWQEAIRHREAIERQVPAHVAHHVSKLWMNLAEFVPDACKVKERDDEEPHSIFSKATTLEDALREGAVYPEHPERLLEEETWHEQSADYNASLT